MKALAFDLFGTLVDVAALETVVSGSVPDPKGFVASWRSKQVEYTFLLALVGRPAAFSEVTSKALAHTCARASLDLDEVMRDRFVGAWRELPAFPDAGPALKSLQGRLPLAVLTNAEPALAREALRAAGLGSFFSEVMSAEEAGSFKPDPHVYEVAERRLRLPKDEIGLVSANVFDVLGAKAAGLRAIWVNRSHELWDPFDVRPDAEIEDLQGLATLV